MDDDTIRRGPLAFSLLFASVLLAAGLAIVNLRMITADEARLIHTQNVLSSLADLFSTLQDVETGQRGYLITGEERFLQPYTHAINSINQRLATVQELTVGDPVQQGVLSAMKLNIAERLAFASKTIERYRIGGHEAAREQMLGDEGRRKMEAIRAQVLAMREAETALLERRRVQVTQSYNVILASIFLGSVLTVGLIVVAWRLTRRDMHIQQRISDLNFERMEWYRTTLESIGDAVISTDAESRVLFMNPVAERLTGCSNAAAQGQPLQQVLTVVNESTGVRVDDPVSRVLATGTTYVLPDHSALVARDGTLHPIEDNAAPIHDRSGNRSGVVLVFHDVSTARAAASALSRSEDRYRNLVTATSQIVWTTDASGQVTDDSPTWRAFTGQTLEQFRGLGWLDAVHSEDRESVRACWAQALETRSLYETEYRLLRLDGEYRYMTVRGVPRLAPDGTVVEWVGMNLDVTESRAAERAVRESEERFSQVADMACEWIWEQDASGRYVYSNNVVEKLLGYEVSELLGRHYLEFQARDPGRDALAGGRIAEPFFRLANHYRRKDGTEIMTESTGAPVLDGEGSITKWRGVDYDVTERKTADEVRLRLAAIVESSNDAVIAKTLDGIITSWNSAAERIFGYCYKEVVNHPLTMLCSPERKSEIEANLVRVRRGERVEHYETIRVRKDGESLPVSITVSPVKDEQGHVIGASETLRDISERRRAEREREVLLERAEEARDLAEAATRAKDEFLALVSHELRTPLNAMQGWVHILRTHADLNPELHSKAADVIARNIEVQRQLIDDLLDSARIVSGKLKIELAPVDLAPVLEAALDVIRSAARAKDIALDVELPGKFNYVEGDATRLQQIFWNLLSNAVKFTPKGGRISVGLDRHETHVRVVISDTGRGIAPEFLPYIFNRYSQAREEHARFRHGGLGLGLALVWHLVELHGGNVSVASAGEGHGARFAVDLPLRALQTVPDTADISLSLEQHNVPDIRGTRILVVDDQASARALLSDVLVGRGCEVVAMANGTEAVNYLSSAAGRDTDLLICDIGLSDEDGYSVIRRIRALEADAAARASEPLMAIALTGYTRPEDRILALRSGFQTHLVKPVEPAELIEVIAALIRPAQSSHRTQQR